MNIAIFYHFRISGGDPPIDHDHAFGILQEQFAALVNSGLAEAAQLIVMATDGGVADAMDAASIAQTKFQIVEHPPGSRSELPTLSMLGKWVKTHPGWKVLYFHTKGAIHKGDGMYDNWRRCMERVVLWNWKQCVADMDAGFDSVGAHWLTPQAYSMVSTPFWGGNFWWATSDFLATLPDILANATSRMDFYQAEIHISKGPRLPKVRDYAPHWPGGPCG